MSIPFFERPTGGLPRCREKACSRCTRQTLRLSSRRSRRGSADSCSAFPISHGRVWPMIQTIEQSTSNTAHVSCAWCISWFKLPFPGYWPSTAGSPQSDSPAVQVSNLAASRVANAAPGSPVWRREGLPRLTPTRDLPASGKRLTWEGIGRYYGILALRYRSHALSPGYYQACRWLVGGSGVRAVSNKFQRMIIGDQ